MEETVCTITRVWQSLDSRNRERRSGVGGEKDRGYNDGWHQSGETRRIVLRWDTVGGAVGASSVLLRGEISWMRARGAAHACARRKCTKTRG